MVSVRCGPRFGTELSLASFMGPPPPHEWGKIFYKKEWASDRKHFSNII